MAVINHRSSDQPTNPHRALHATGSRRARARGQTTVATTQPDRLPDAIYERTMRQLGVSAGTLTAVLLALIARTVVDGLSFVNGLAETLTAVCLIASLRLRRTGRRLIRDANPGSPGSTRRPSDRTDAESVTLLDR